MTIDAIKNMILSCDKISIIQQYPWGSTYKLVRNNIVSIIKMGPLANNEIEFYKSRDAKFQFIKKPKLLSFGTNWLELEYIASKYSSVSNKLEFAKRYLQFQKDNVTMQIEQCDIYQNRINQSRLFLQEILNKDTIKEPSLRMLRRILDFLFYHEQLNFEPKFLKLPTTICHGDLHSENIIPYNKDYFLIDWSDVLNAPPGFCLSGLIEPNPFILIFTNKFIHKSHNVISGYLEWIADLTGFMLKERKMLLTYLAVQSNLYSLANLTKFYSSFNCNGRFYFNKLLYTYSRAINDLQRKIK